ncbi:MAG: type II toxin-antitoxin system VapC family toxin [Firmicutes bacterium]|jgi:protein tyrosine phosphatase|nr:type II toxin-antitoxin system VapC family toxin [Bacillota bacterium]
MNIYLDNCSFNRPFDDQTQLKINLESQAKLFIQKQITLKKYDLVWSFILEFENSKNPYEIRRHTVLKWRDLATIKIQSNQEIVEYAEGLNKIGVKAKDALHIASAVYGKSEYFITTDKKLLNLKLDDIKICSPIKFINDTEG